MDKTYLQTVANKRRDILWNKACEIWPEIAQYTRPEIELNNRLKTTAGRAHCAYNNNEHKIDLSTELFWEYTQEFVTEIIPHEMAHIVDYIVNGYRSGWATSHNHLWEDITLKLRGYVLPKTHRLINTMHEARKAKAL